MVLKYSGKTRKKHTGYRWCGFVRNQAINNHGIDDDKWVFSIYEEGFQLIHPFDTKTWFNTKMPGSAQQYPPQYASVVIAIIKHPSFPMRIICFNFIQIFCF